MRWKKVPRTAAASSVKSQPAKPRFSTQLSFSCMAAVRLLTEARLRGYPLILRVFKCFVVDRKLAKC